MNQAWKRLKPKDRFTVQTNGYLTGTDFEVLHLLYQPIIGVEAFGLLTALLTEAKIAKQPAKHAVLLNQLDIGLPALYEARSKLEAMGLLKSFVREMDDGYHFIYVVVKPLEPRLFLMDDALSLLLLERVGENRFNELTALFTFTLEDIKSFKEVTRSFTDVFSLSQEQFIVNEKRLLDTAKSVNEPLAKSKVNPESNTFNWEFFKEQVVRLHVNETYLEKELKRTIDTFHHLYGIDELDMLELVKQCLDYVTNEIDIKRFKQLVYKQYHHVPKSNVVEVNLTPESQVKQDNTLKWEGFSEGEVAVIKACEQTPPMVFIKAIKTQKKGFVSPNERWTVENLRNQSPLPDPVINMLVHYLLAVQGQPSLNQNMVNSIGNDWAQDNIHTAKDALLKVKAFQEEKTTKKPPRKNNYRPNNRTESLPDWATKERTKETPLSDEEQRFFEEQLKQLGQTRKEGDTR